uniref:Uncharacterized protein n=1 Tax=Anguilla anguilla TaxID=7936 RepID=A0A0E9S9R5_ANGAN
MPFKSPLMDIKAPFYGFIHVRTLVFDLWQVPQSTY